MDKCKLFMDKHKQIEIVIKVTKQYWDLKKSVNAIFWKVKT